MTLSSARWDSPPLVACRLSDSNSLPGGRTAVFDKFLRDDERPSLKRRLLNAIAKPLFSDALCSDRT